MSNIARWLMVSAAVFLAVPAVADAQVGARFEVVGQIIDRGEKGFLLWGQAMSQDPNAYGALWQPSNIMVVGMEPMAGGFVGTVCFRGKSQAKNAYGTPVPVWVYGNCNGK
jgi:hypothetical protein